MHFFVLALLISLVLAVIAAVITFIFDEDANGEYVVAAFVASVIVNTSLTAAYLYWTIPNQAGPLYGFAWVFWPVLITMVIFAFTAVEDYYFPAIIGFYGVVVVVMAGWFIIGVMGPWSNDTAQAQASRISVTEAAADTYPSSDPTHIVQVTEDIASFKARQSMATGQYEGDTLESIFTPGDPVLQSVNGHLYYVVDLDYASGRVRRSADVNVPGYIMVDAEDPSQQPRLVLDYDMQYVPSGWMSNKLSRHIYNNGYRDVVLDDLTIEIDDEGRPWYTLAISEYIAPGAFNGIEPVGFLVVNPEDGEITEYPLDDIPEWVDRVYSAETVADALSDWGRWDKAELDKLFEKPFNRFKVAGEPGLVYSDDDKAVWQVTMTSYNGDTAASAVVLVDARTGEAVSYDTSDGVTIESNVIDVISSSGDNLKGLVATNPQLYNIYGRLTWVAVLEPGDEDGSKTSFAGIAILPANQVDASSVILGDTLDSSLRDYRRFLSRSGGADDPTQTSDGKTVEGVVEVYNTVVDDGNTIFIVRLSGEEQIFAGEFNENYDLALVSEGDTVRIRYNDLSSENGVAELVNLSIMEPSSS